MKKIYKSFVAITCLILAFVSIALVGCNNTKVEKITLSKTSLSLVEGTSETLTATITPDEAKDETITWTSSDEKIAKVDNGKVTAVAKGEATITAKAGDKEATCKVTVTEPVAVTGITLDQSTATVEVDKTVTLKATVTPDNATDKTVTWTSDKTNIATVANGVVTGVAAGEAKITAKAGDFTATCTVTVTAAASQTTTDFFTKPTGAISLGNQSFTNNTDIAIKKGTGNVYTVTGTASKFTADQATAFGGAAENDRYITIKIDNASKAEVEIGWLDASNGTLSSSSEGYKTVSDNEFILWVNRTNQKKFFCVKLNSASYILDITGLTVTDTASHTFLDGATFAVNASTQAVTLDGVKFANTASLKLAETDNRKVFELSGTAPTFNTSNAQGESKSQAAAFGNVAARDSFVVLTFNNPNKKQVEMGWIEKNEDGTFNTTLNSTTTPGYKKLTAGNTIDTDMILWLNRPNRTNYFCVTVDTGNNAKTSILDVSKATISQFFTVETKKVDINGKETTTNPFENKNTGDSNINISITKQIGANNTADVDVYEVTGTATKFTSGNAGVFNGASTSPKLVDEAHRYIAFRVNQPENEKYRSGWVSTPDEALNTSTDDSSYGSTISKVNGTLDNERILWVTRPEAAGKNYYKIEVKGGRSYVLDISKLDTGNNILTAATGRWDKESKQLTDSDAKGFQNQHTLTFTANGNVTKITGHATAYTTTNAAEIDSTSADTQQKPKKGDEYIVVKVNVPNDTSNSTKKWKYGWVKTPGTKLCDGNNAGTNAEWGCTNGCVGVREWAYNDNMLILWVTRQGTSGYYLRVETGYESNGATRAYVYDLRDLLSDKDNGERVQDFFKVENESVTEGSYHFQNGVGSDLKIEKVEGKENYWKISGKATKFNSTNKSAFPTEITGSSGTPENNFGYVVFRMNVKKNTSGSGSSTDKITFGWIDASKVGNVQDSDLQNSKPLTTFNWNEQMVMLVNRSGRTQNIWCVKVEDDGQTNYFYLDFSGITKAGESFVESDFCADCTSSS